MVDPRSAAALHNILGWSVRPGLFDEPESIASMNRTLRSANRRVTSHTSKIKFVEQPMLSALR